ncbi:MAG TPA: hypothetical protein PLA83_10375 [Deltaproteobacteria bacterium]|jgi:hypothetical protein|nr:hypothetical protein [Deltaproteobacteria bacterium]HQI01741.1 hypothetical protein [Deltaproteobacteria bacterium]HQJ08743.1 hypothetical protein [Deltaproteobacteria bacterium]
MRKEELKHVTTIVVLILVLAAAVMAFIRAAPSSSHDGSGPGTREPHAISTESEVRSPSVIG